MDKIDELLKKYWGYTSFLPHQKEIIESLLKGQDTIAIMVISQKAKELHPVRSFQEDFPPLVSTAGNVIQGPRIFNPNRSSHNSRISYLLYRVKFQGLTPLEL